MATTKELIYTEAIAPLMIKIAEVCDEHKIAMLADFHLGYDETTGDSCSAITTRLTPDYNPSGEQMLAVSMMYCCDAEDSDD